MTSLRGHRPPEGTVEGSNNHQRCPAGALCHYLTHRLKYGPGELGAAAAASTCPAKSNQSRQIAITCHTCAGRPEFKNYDIHSLGTIRTRALVQPLYFKKSLVT